MLDIGCEVPHTVPMSKRGQNITIALTVIGAFALSWWGIEKNDNYTCEKAGTYVVTPGDTIWKIMEKAGCEGDLQHLSYNIRQTLGGSADIWPGDIIVVPQAGG